MKKKGLIISTVVMVVVLIAALTTTTFAWFSTTASATIDDLEINTKAATGLDMSIYEIQASSAGSAITTPLSGNVTWSTSKWTGDQSQWGASVAFDELPEYMAASGDGLKMFKLGKEDAVSNSGAVATGTSVVAAAANTDYFEVNLALRNTTEEAKEIVIKNISVKVKTVEGKDITAGMAASLRIALFAKTTMPTTEANFASTDLKAVFLPFGDMTFQDGAWNQASLSNDATTYLTAIADDYSSVSKSESGFEDYTVGNGKASTAPDECTGAEIQILKETTPATTGNILYTKLVIWFEGEDPECRNQFAGGGATIDIEFGFKAAA